jgi:hypothetical protein
LTTNNENNSTLISTLSVLGGLGDVTVVELMINSKHVMHFSLPWTI